MKSITIHGVDEQLVNLIQSKAQSQALSINKTIKMILEEALGVKPRDKATYHSDFEEFFGIWSDSELRDFNSRSKGLTKIDREDWQ